MSRKTKLTIFTDKLSAISECPGEIFNKFDPSDEDFENIKNAENGDIVALRDILLSLYDIYGNDRDSNAALSYFLQKGVAAGDATAAELMIKYIDRFNEHFELLDTALDIIGDTNPGLAESVTYARLKSVLSSVTASTDFAALNSLLADMPAPLVDHARIYLAAKERYYTGSCSTEVRAIAEGLGMPSIFYLPIFCGEGSTVGIIASAGEADALVNALRLINMDEWRDLWLAAIYEHAMLTKGGELGEVAQDILSAIETRVDYKRKPLHLLALKRYLSDRGLGYSEDECRELEVKCRFSGLETDEDTDALIKEAVYTSGADERKTHKARTSLGTEILHERNRYSLTATLSDHQKRASKHQWKCVLSIESENGEPPIISPLPIIQMRAEVMRNGVAYGKEKKTAQVLCSGNITIGERISPFEVDLILDISYVSATKCTHCDVRIERYKKLGDHIVMQTIISIY